MEPILISFSICLLGVMVAVFLFSVAMRGKAVEDEAQSGERPPSPHRGFFLEEDPDSPPTAGLPSESILLQLERHFRMEESAATSYLEGPTIESLHAPSFTPLWD